MSLFEIHDFDMGVVRHPTCHTLEVERGTIPRLPINRGGTIRRPAPRYERWAVSEDSATVCDTCGGSLEDDIS